MAATNSIRLFLCGDVMTGRGIDQILPAPSEPILHEPSIRDARVYVELAEEENGAIKRPVGFDYIWGDALPLLLGRDVDLRIINLETSITTSDAYWRDKFIHYRMQPRNAPCLTAARIDCCCVANNHVLDWGHDGLQETLETLDALGVSHAGAGRDSAEAARPAILEVPGKARVLVFAYGSPTSGVPREWKATASRPGVNFLPEISERSADSIAESVRRYRKTGDVVIVSVHTGPNWGYELSDEEIRFAHRLVEQGVNIVHGHSSHHVKTAELYRGRPILYGCGDFLNDYEGISGFQEYRSDLGLMYLFSIDPTTGLVTDGRFIPMRTARMRLNRASEHDGEWLRQLLSKLGQRFETEFDLSPDGSIVPRTAGRLGNSQP